jgi:hypothetical protein
MLHLPRTCFVAVHTARQGANRTDVDAHPTFIALKVIAVVRNNLGRACSIGDAKRPDSHPFVTDPHAAEAQYAPWTVKVDYRRPLHLVEMLLELFKPSFPGAVGERGILEFTLAALVADRTI